MKSTFKLVVFLLISVVLFGCGSKKETEFVKKCELTSNDVANGYKLDSVYEIHGTGKTVDSVVTTETVISEDEDTLNYFKEYLSSTYESYNKSYGGYTNEITIENGKLVSKTTIDYSKMDLKKYVADNSAMKNYVSDDNKILLDGIKNIYESLGASCE